MGKEQLEKMKEGLSHCDNSLPLAECHGCPYENYPDCTARLISDCGAYIREKEQK